MLPLKVMISIKTVFIVLLFSSFLHWFGVPSIQRYLENKTHIVTTIEATNGVPSPAVTICGEWKDKGADYKTQNIINQTCSSVDDVSACIEKNTYSFGELVSSAFQIHIGQNVSLNDSKLWKEDFTEPTIGKCFTFVFSSDLQVDSYFLFKLQQDSSSVFIHDPKYFLVNYNPAMPFIVKILGKSIPSQFLRLKMIKHNKKNLPTRPCEENEDYNFQVLLSHAELLDLKLITTFFWTTTDFSAKTNSFMNIFEPCQLFFRWWPIWQILPANLNTF